jgi:histidine triad (HIT) family protein
MPSTTQPDCIFCKIVNGQLPSSKIYEDGKCLAVLDLFPITKGQTIVMAKEHLDSNFTNIDGDFLKMFVTTAQHIAKKLEKALGAKRVGLIVEGAQVPHLHAKLYPFPNLESDGSGEFNLSRGGEVADRGVLDGLAGMVTAQK